VEHLSTTIGLVSTFRHHRISNQSGDDVLQLYTTLLHAWCSLVRFHELYSKHPEMDSEGVCSLLPTSIYTQAQSAEHATSSEVMNIETDHAPPHVMPTSSNPPLATTHDSQSRKRRKPGARRKGNLSCPVSTCVKLNFSRVGLLDHM
jgi:hypothetical protein